MEEVIREFRRPVPVESVGFKVQAFFPKQDPKRAQIVSFIDARQAAERLNHVVPGEWGERFLPAAVGTGLECRLQVRGVTHADVGFSPDTTTDMGIKALYSDAFKRAAVKFGIGAFLYSLPKLVVPVGDLTEWKGKFSLFDDSPAMGKAKAAYTAWLEAHGVQHFGEPLSHGDMEGAQGDIEADDSLAGMVVETQTPRAPLLVEFLRGAIRGFDQDELKDDTEWKAMVQSADTAEDKAKLVEGLEAKLVELSDDPDRPRQVREAWEKVRARNGAAA